MNFRLTRSRLLEASGLVRKHREGRTVRCSLNAGPLQDALNWIANYRRFWTDQLDALDDYLDGTDEENER